MHLGLLLCHLLLFCSLASCLPLLAYCPLGCCCPRPGILVLCESLGLRALPRSVPLTTSALSVARNHLCNVDNVLWRFSSLQELSLGHNQLERFPRGLPSSLENLQLQQNRITYITAGDLRNLGNLTRLDLEDNRIRAIQPGALLGLTRLRTLSLKGNRLSTLPLRLPASLKHLDVSANCISMLDLPSLAALVNLEVLRINSNCLRSVPERAFDSLRQLRTVALADNLWLCECDILYLYRWLLTDRLRMATDLVCAAPLHLAHKLLLTLSVMAICPNVLKPGERFASLNATTVGKAVPGGLLKEPPDHNSPDNVTKKLRRSCRMNSSRTFPSRTHTGSNQSSLQGLSQEQCLLLNSTFLVSQPTQIPSGPVLDEDTDCVDNTTKIDDTSLSTYASYTTSEAGLQFGATPQTLSHPSDPVLVILLSVLCVLTGLLLLIALGVLRGLMWRNQRVAPLPSSVSNQRDTSS